MQNKIEEFKEIEKRAEPIPEEELRRILENVREEAEKGGPGSGSWDGPGRPRFAWHGLSKPAPPPIEKMKRSIVIDGKRVQPDGSPLPEHIAHLAIPPAWTNVIYSDDPNASLLVRGNVTTGKRKYQYIYSKKHKALKDEAKYSKENELDEKFDNIYKENQKLMNSKDKETREAAACLNLIMETGIRPGSDERRGRRKAYGATTLEGRHLVELKRGVELHFTGKSGVDLKVAVTNEATIKDLKLRAERAGVKGKLFDTDEDSVLEHAKKLNGGGFQTKDFRTHIGTRTAIRAIKDMKKPSTMKEYKKAVREVGKIVARKLGNTPTVALQSYINPTVFAEWRVNL